MHNPFAALPAAIPPIAIQIYVVVMFLLVIFGTLIDLVHKGSAKYFFKQRQNASFAATRAVGAGEVAGIAAKTILVTVLAAGEFCGALRRLTHLLTMYGFVLYVVTTAMMVFAYSTAAAPGPAIVADLWYVGAASVCVGGYWFWFLQRVDVVAEGRSPLRLVRADLFILSLVATTTFALIWARVQASGDQVWANVCFGFYLLANTVLFASVPWSKFAHMFYKPAAAFQKGIEQANGFRRNLPAPADQPATLGSARRQPHNY